jgi:hypothetical protein
MKRTNKTSEAIVDAIKETIKSEGKKPVEKKPVEKKTREDFEHVKPLEKVSKKPVEKPVPVKPVSIVPVGTKFLGYTVIAVKGNRIVLLNDNFEAWTADIERVNENVFKAYDFKNGKNSKNPFYEMIILA